MDIKAPFGEHPPLIEPYPTSPEIRLDDLLAPLRDDAELTPAQVEAAVAALTDEAVPDAAKAAFLRALRLKGETPGEIAGFAHALLARAVDPGIDPATARGPLLDVCGTGGDRLGLFNVSTTASFVLAAGGVVVVKHGNRAITSRSGGADVLATLGVRLDLPPAELRRCVAEVGMGFLFAPHYHPAFRAVIPVRRQLAAEGTSTIFNLLGPLLNPARPANQLAGVFSGALTPVFAEVLRQLGRQRVWAVHGAGGMDELSTLGATDVSRFDRISPEPDADGGAIIHEQVFPEDAGLRRVEDVAALRGGESEENARVLTGILAGEIDDARLDLVLFNAAAGFVVTGLAADLREGVARGREVIGDGHALECLRDLRRFGEDGGA